MLAAANDTLRVTLRKPHPYQDPFIQSTAKRKIVRAGRRGGKTVGMAIMALLAFKEGKRILYATPTEEQIARFWWEITQALYQPIQAGIFKKNETLHTIELPNSLQRIRAKTAWNKDTLRGDYGDLVILDEFQLMDPDVLEYVVYPMLLDNNGDLVIVYTPFSLRDAGKGKNKKDPLYASKLYKKWDLDTTGRYAAFHFTTRQNPYISRAAISELTKDMTGFAIRQEIDAEDTDEAPGALWTRDIINRNRVVICPALEYIVVAVDPSTTSGGDEAGIVTAGRKDGEFYPLADDSLQGSPAVWAQAAVDAYYRHQANLIVAESNNGGEMVELTIHTIDPTVPVELVHASRGKQTRAEPISAQYEHNRVHHVGEFAAMEYELCVWTPGMDSPNRLDALVWAITKLMEGASTSDDVQSLGRVDDYRNPWS
jgi:hypothetical protein